MNYGRATLIHIPCPLRNPVQPAASLATLHGGMIAFYSAGPRWLLVSQVSPGGRLPLLAHGHTAKWLLGPLSNVARTNVADRMSTTSNG